MNQYIITEGGIGELELYFMEHHDDFFGIAWKNFKDKHIQPYNPQAEREKVLDKLDGVTKLEDFLEWVADRLEFVYHDSPRVDFILSLRKRAKAARELRQEGKDGEYRMVCSQCDNWARFKIKADGSRPCRYLCMSCFVKWENAHPEICADIKMYASFDRVVSRG